MTNHAGHPGTTRRAATAVGRETYPEAGTTLAGQGSRQVNAMCHGGIGGRGNRSYDPNES